VNNIPGLCRRPGRVVFVRVGWPEVWQEDSLRRQVDHLDDGGHCRGHDLRHEDEAARNSLRRFLHGLWLLCYRVRTKVAKLATSHGDLAYEYNSKTK
jgi:hypothetical protein